MLISRGVCDKGFLEYLFSFDSPTKVEIKPTLESNKVVFFVRGTDELK